VVTDTFTQVMTSPKSGCARWLPSTFQPHQRLGSHVTPRDVNNVLKHLIGSFYNVAYDGNDWTEDWYAKPGEFSVHHFFIFVCIS